MTDKSPCPPKRLAGWELVGRAIDWAARAHRHQLRKDGSTPSVSHAVRVGWCVEHLFGIKDPEVLAAAVLHDVIEDTTTDFDDLEEHFGPRVARLVAALSKDKRLPRPRREAAYHDQLLAAEEEVWLIKLADLHENLIDVARIPAAQLSEAIARLGETFASLEAKLRHRWPQAVELVAARLEQLQSSLR